MTEPASTHGIDPKPGTTEAEVLDHGWSPALLDRLRVDWSASWFGRHRRVVVRTGLIAVAVGAAGIFVSQRPSPAPAMTRALVAGVSIDVSHPPGTGNSVGPIVATYQVTSSSPDVHLSVDGVSGPFLGGSSVSAMPAARGGQLVVVRATPDCGESASLDPPRAPYQLAISRTGPDGRTVHGLVHVTASPVDWGTAVRRACWQALTARTVQIHAVRAELPKVGRLITLRVTLRSAAARDLQIRVIDIADVSTIAAADSGVLRGGGQRTFRVRLPIRDCSSPTLPLSAMSADGIAGTSGAAATAPALTWSVGPVDADPLALVQTALSPSQVMALRLSAQRLCAPPRTEVRVSHASVLASNAVVVDHTGVSILIRLRLVSDAPRIVVGDTQVGLTADARVATTQANMRLYDGRGRASIVWHARCVSPDLAPPVLPVWLSVHGHLVGHSVEMADQRLATTYAEACRISDPGRMRTTGWKVDGWSKAGV